MYEKMANFASFLLGKMVLPLILIHKEINPPYRDGAVVLIFGEDGK
jgi:hypothetical protein